MASVTKNEVFGVMIRKTGFEVVTEKEGVNQLRFIGRCSPERFNFLLPVMHQLLTASARPDTRWTCDISKMYMLSNGRVLYGWRFIFQAERIAECYDEIVAIVQAAPRPSRVEVTSITLPGYKPGQVRGGVNSKGKGVSSAESIPMAVTRGRP